MFKITSIEIKKIEKEASRLVGLARVVVDDCFAINDLRIIRGSEKRGLFVAFPNRKQEKGKFKDICHPINQECRNFFEKTIIETFEKEAN